MNYNKEQRVHIITKVPKNYQEKYLYRLLRSIESQTYQNYEHILLSEEEKKLNNLLCILTPEYRQKITILPTMETITTENYVILDINTNIKPNYLEIMITKLETSEYDIRAVICHAMVVSEEINKNVISTTPLKSTRISPIGIYNIKQNHNIYACQILINGNYNDLNRIEKDIRLVVRDILKENDIYIIRDTLATIPDRCISLDMDTIINNQIYRLFK